LRQGYLYQLTPNVKTLAWVVYSRLGLAILRKAWLNLNLVWAAALVVTGLVTLVM
jgi:hypothetical protein